MFCVPNCFLPASGLLALGAAGFGSTRVGKWLSVSKVSLQAMRNTARSSTNIAFWLVKTDRFNQYEMMLIYIHVQLIHKSNLSVSVNSNVSFVLTFDLVKPSAATKTRTGMVNCLLNGWNVCVILPTVTAAPFSQCLLGVLKLLWEADAYFDNMSCQSQPLHCHFVALLILLQSLHKFLIFLTHRLPTQRIRKN